MKKLFGLAFIITAASMLFLSSCQQDTTPVNSNMTDKYDAAIFNVPNENSVEIADITEPTLENEMTLCPPRDNKDNNGKGDMKQPPRSRYIPLGMILRQLKLSDRQLEALKGFMESHKDCAQRVTMRYREARFDLLKKANETRKEILEKYKNDRPAAREALKRLNFATRNEMQKLNAAVQDAMKKCICALFDDIRSILTREQLAKFEAWVAKYHSYCVEKKQ